MAPENITMVNGTALEIEVKTVNDDLQSLLEFTWEAKSYWSTRLKILVTFKYPGQISQDLMDRDRISVKVLNPTLFLSEALPIRSVKNETVVLYKLQRQFEQSAQEIMQKIEA